MHLKRVDQVYNVGSSDSVGMDVRRRDGVADEDEEGESEGEAEWGGVLEEDIAPGDGEDGRWFAPRGVGRVRVVTGGVGLAYEMLGMVFLMPEVLDEAENCCGGV